MRTFKSSEHDSEDIDHNIGIVVALSSPEDKGEVPYNRTDVGIKLSKLFDNRSCYHN